MNMKKLLSGVLVMVMALSMMAAALAEPFVFEEEGVIVEIPEGMTATDMSDENGSSLVITVNDNASLIYAYYFAYSEEMAGKYLDDLSEEEETQLVQSIAAGMGSAASYSIVEGDDYLIMVVENEDTTQVHLLTLLEGWLFDVALGKLDGVALTEEEIEIAVQMLVGSQFVEEAQ